MTPQTHQTTWPPRLWDPGSSSACSRRGSNVLGRTSSTYCTLPLCSGGTQSIILSWNDRKWNYLSEASTSIFFLATEVAERISFANPPLICTFWYAFVAGRTKALNPARMYLHVTCAMYNFPLMRGNYSSLQSLWQKSAFYDITCEYIGLYLI